MATCPFTSVGEVILYHGGEAKTSSVHKIGGMCWVAWYTGIEKVILKSDGTADDPPFHYTWMLDVAGPDIRENDFCLVQE